MTFRSSGSEVRVVRRCHPALPTSSRVLVLQILGYVRRHLSDHDLTPERIAEAQHISVRHLYKVCEQNGISLEVWIIGQRLEAAKATLATGRGRQRTIATVAHAWGFANPSHFAKRFRASYGMTPTEWRTTSQL